MSHRNRPTAQATTRLHAGSLLRGRAGPLIVHAFIATPVALAAWLGGDPSLTLLMGGALALIGYPVIVGLEMRMTPLVLGPLSFFFAWQWLVMGVAGLWVGLDVVGGVAAFPFSAAMVSADDLASGYALFLLGLLAFHCGASVFRPVDRQGPDPVEGAFPEAQYAILWLVGLIAPMLLSRMSWVGSLVGVIGSASTTALCALAVRGKSGRPLPRSTWSLLAGGIMVGFLLGLLGNSKGQAMLSLLPLAWLALRSHRPARSLATLVVAATVLYAALVYPLVTAARNSGFFHSAGAGYSVESLTTTYSEAARDNVEWRATAEAFLERVFDPTPVGFLVAQVRAFGFRYGETMDYLLYSFVPRTIWPDKPTVSRGAWFHVYVGGSSSVEHATSSLGQTAAGELYWNFGVPGLAIGLFASGLVFGWLWRLAGPDPRGSPIRMLLYLNLLLGAGGLMESEWGSGFTGLVFRAIVFYALLNQFATRRRRLGGLRHAH